MQNFDLVLRFKSEAKISRNSRKLNQSINVLRFKSDAKIHRNSRKLNQSITGGSHDFRIWKTIPLRSIV